MSSGSIDMYIPGEAKFNIVSQKTQLLYIWLLKMMALKVSF